jgi:H+/gluconate symporter-like permease
MFKEANIPKRLLPAACALGFFTFSMDAFPGTPQIQNIIPTTYYGTTSYAAPISGLVGGTLIFIVGMLWLEWRRKTAMGKGEGYGDHTLNEPAPVKEETALPKWYIAVLPLVLVLVLNFYYSRVYSWDPELLKPFVPLGIALMAPAVKNVIGIWGIIIGVTAGIGLALALGFRNLPKKNGLQNAINVGAIGSLLATLNTGSEVGYGNVIAALPGFKTIADAVMGIKIGGTPLVSEAIGVTTLAGITGSASGGMAIALSLMGKDWLAWANSVGVSPEILHRVASMASGGMDSLPHNGAIITLLAVCGLTHRQSYGDIFMITLIKTSMVFVIIALYLITGIY